MKTLDNPSALDGRLADANDFLRRGWTRIIPMLLFALVTCVFWPCLRGQFIYFDDAFYVTDNVHVNTGLSWGNIAWSWRGAGVSMWHPLTWISHMLDCQLYGLNPWGHHLTSVLLHAASTALVFVVFQQMTGSLWRSLVMALLFGLHPLRVESVAWICERKDVLSTFFGLLTLWAYVKYAKSVSITDQSVTRHPSLVNPFYALALLFFLLALMSKAMAVTLPGVLLLLDFWPLERRRVRVKGREQEPESHQLTLSRLVIEKIPFLALAIIAGLFEYAAEHEGGRVASISGLPLAGRLENALVSYVRYLGNIFWPARLCAFYPHPGYWRLALVLACGLALLVISVLAFGLRRQQPALLIGWLWYLGTLIPVIGLLQIGDQAMADRYVYFPSFGVLIMLAWGIPDFIRHRHYAPAMIFTMAVLAVVACAGVTRHQIGFWKDSITVFRRAIAVTKNNFVAHSDLGYLLGQQHRYAEAYAEFEISDTLRPGSAETQNDLGRVLAEQEMFAEAESHFRKATELQPNFGMAHYNLGFALSKIGRKGDAVIQYLKAIELEPRLDTAYNNLGSILAEKGKMDKAIALFEKCVQIQPANLEAQINLGEGLLQKGMADEAAVHFKKALELQPDNFKVRSNLDFALHASQSQTPDAKR